MDFSNNKGNNSNQGCGREVVSEQQMFDSEQANESLRIIDGKEQWRKLCGGEKNDLE